MQAKISRVRNMDNRVVAHDWRFADERRADIARHWADLAAEKPALYDGRVLMACATRIDGDAFVSQHFETSFSAFISWRDFGFPDMAVRNVFSMGALRSADGAFLLGEMGAHTANAGKVYFPAGTPDPGDVRDGCVDLAGSVARELMEETGIDIADCAVDPVWTLVEMGLRTACMRPLSIDAPAEEIAARVAATLAQEKEPELAGLRIVRSMADLDRLDTQDFIRAYLAAEFAKT